jgi:hypothetical protein
VEALSYLECDVPEGVTLRQWRGSRRPCSSTEAGRHHPWLALRRMIRRRR